MTAQRNVRGAGMRGTRRFLALVLSLGALVGGATTQAQPDPPTGAAAASGGRAGSSAAPLGRAPSMYETGRVGAMKIQEQGVQIRQTSGRSQPPREQRVDAKTSAPPAPAPAGGRVIDQATFERTVRERFAQLRTCKLEVARQRRTTPAALAGSRLTLGWTILPNGHVADTRVVAVARVDGRVADCLKRQMSQWAFDPPRGGAVVVERPFRFDP